MSAFALCDDYVRGLFASPEDPGGGLQDCVQLSYHRARRHLLLLLLPREVLLIDLQLLRPVGAVPADKSGSPFVQVSPAGRLGGAGLICRVPWKGRRCPA